MVAGISIVRLCQVAKPVANGEPARSVNQAAIGRGTIVCKQTITRASSNISRRVGNSGLVDCDLRLEILRL